MATSWMFAMVSMRPMAKPDTAMATANTRTLWHKGMMAKITEMRSADTNKADRAVDNLEWRVKDDEVSGIGRQPPRTAKFCLGLYLRPLENAADRAAYQQAELLREEHPGDLSQRGLGLTLQVQNGRPQEGDAQSKAEENTPVSQRVMGVPFEESHYPIIHKHLGRPERQPTTVCIAESCLAPF